MKVAFYRPDYQKFLICPLIKGLGQAFVSNICPKLLKVLEKLLKVLEKLLENFVQLFEGLRENKKLGQDFEKFD